MRIGSLFSGVGGLDLAVEAVTGGAVAWQAEVDPYASHVLARRWPSTPNLGDVREIHSPPAVDALCGGFPCQDISSAGKREGINGKKSGLWRDFARIIRDAQPGLVFVENVAALRSRGLGVVLGDLAGLGFDAEWGCLSVSDVGGPQRRRRMFVLAHKGGDTLRLIAERGEQLQAKRWDAEPRVNGGDLADTMHDGRGSGGEAHDNGGSDAHWNDPHGRDEGVRYPPGPRDGAAWSRWPGPVPGVRRGAYGAPDSVDARRRRGRLRCLGNGVAPRQAAAAFLMLARRAMETESCT